MKRARFDSSQVSPPSETEHQPKVSRKIRACQACQNRKIKCDLEHGQEQCARCARLGLKCVVNKSLQTLLDGENEWKKNIEAQMQSLQAALSEVQRALNMPRPMPTQLPNVQQNDFPSGSQVSAMQPVPQTHPDSSVPIRPTGMTRENSVEAEAQEADDQAMVNAPMASLFEVTKLRNVRSEPWARIHRPSSRTQKPDFISQGKFDLQEAERLFARFRETLNAYLWGGIALLHDSLEGARASSSLLTAAILAVTSLHAQDDGRAFDICYPIFLELVSQAMFDRYHTLDDVRGLCIGAFYLSDLSWKLSGLAVRIATELNVHQFCAMALRDRPEYVEEARLWYFLYVCDHHFSIAYGRPPVISENSTLSCHEDFLRLPGITMSDHRLHSQVGVFIILSRIYHVFGPDRSRMIANDEFEILRRFDIDLARWRDQWKPRLAPNPHIADYPAKGVILHYHFARVQLFAICLRGLRPSEQFRMSNERREFVNLAIGSAFGALELILNDPDMRRAVMGVPLYLLTTIAYACLFLMKAQTQWRSANLNIRYENVLSVIEGVVVLLEETSPCVRHVAHYLGRGLNGMLQKFKDHNAVDKQQILNGQPVPVAYADGGVWPDWNSWMFGTANVPNQFGLDQEQQYGLSFLDALSSQMPG
ncbi:fungal specific transcription factor [Pochonia chlamydosporia 170]|uniref:Fungal specific transcription factor n=1 Tax=Pochonia chlamydosporia 170 TaxID=1380566 RepID=A0A179FZ88_METCM|nr:fungal specific transcription factor [Pochonia chlamydosporia 170]OAQ70985.1 fungal specific transcription factor [Pochonia chlamydosporia 170]